MDQEPEKEHKMFGRDESYKSSIFTQPAKDPAGKAVDNVAKKYGEIMNNAFSPSFYWRLFKKLFK